MNRIIPAILLCMFCSLISPVHAATVAQITSAMGRELDRQVAQYLGTDSPVHGVSIYVTTPVSINDLQNANPLARQIQEELTRWFVQAGYKVQEIRKGASLLFDDTTGELLLSRNPEELASTDISSDAVLVGTYTVTGMHVRFNIRLVQAASHEIIAMSTQSIPLTPEVSALLGSGSHSKIRTAIEPSVFTRLP